MNILIIGGTSGIGHELWRRYTENTENKVAVAGRRTALLEEMKRQRPESTCCYTLDITQTETVGNGIKQIFQDLGHVDIAIVCAGIGDLNPELKFEKEVPTLQTNILGWTASVTNIYKLFEAQGNGHLVTVTSIGGLSGEPSAPAYSASKAYQINYTKALQKKTRKTNIHVTEIRPGLVDTAMAKGEGLFWVMPVEKVAEQIIKAIKKRKTMTVVTKRWKLPAWMMRHFNL